MVPNKQIFYYIGLVTQLGLVIIISILAGLFLGIFLDNKLQTKPWFTIIFLIFGVVGGFRGAYRLIMAQEKKDEGTRASGEEDKF